MKRGFFAYSSDPTISESVENAIDDINGAGVVQIDGWKSLRIGGRSLIGRICQAIDDAELFLAELTHLNPNVLFELGYAIAKNRRILLFHDPSVERSDNDIRRFSLATVGIEQYHNSSELTAKYFDNAPHDDIESTILSEVIAGGSVGLSRPTGMLYLKSPIQTQAALTLTQRIIKAEIEPLVVDDPAEMRMQLYDWYIEVCGSTFAVVAHLLSPDQRDHRLHNAKASFAAGLGYGFGREVLMLAHGPYETPIDFKHLLGVHRTGKECGQLYDRWYAGVDEKYIERQQREVDRKRRTAARSTLQSLQLGDFIAERETDTLSEYFVDTAAYGEASRARYSIFVGRKGTGKTAIMQQLRTELSQDKRNHLCMITPISYELHGLVDLLQKVAGTAERGFLVESLWKFLVYTQIALSYKNVLDSRPLYYEPTETESELLRLVADQTGLFDPDFSVRLGYAIERCEQLTQGNLQQSRVQVSELLHAELISRLASILRDLFEPQNRVAVLVDNLDKAWSHGSELDILSEFLFGLLSVTGRINSELGHHERPNSDQRFSIIVFLRSDIFTHLLRRARERDKIPHYSLKWDDPQLLADVIEARLSNGQAWDSPSDAWDLLFAETIQGVPTRQFILGNILPRPRDIVFLVKAALTRAIRRKHNRIEEDDLLEAMSDYSQHALDSLIVENGISVTDFEALIYEFAGGSQLISEASVIKAMERASITDISSQDLIELLCERSFLGREVDDGQFRFQYDASETEICASLERSHLRESGAQARRFQINQPFCFFLEIKHQSVDFGQDSMPKP